MIIDLFLYRIGMLIFQTDIALRAAIGSMLSIIAAIAYREVEPYASPTVNTLSTASMWLVVLVYLSGVTIENGLFPYSDWALGLVLCGYFTLVITMGVLLQLARGSSHREIEQQLLEQEAREVDLRLGHNEMVAFIDGVRMSELQRKSLVSLESHGLDSNGLDSNVQVTFTVEPTSIWAERKLSAKRQAKRSLGMLANDGLNSTRYPCFVVEHATLLSFDRLPFHEDAVREKSAIILQHDTREPSPSHTYFISQNWEGALGSGPGGAGRHPDNAINSKLRWLKNMKRHLHIPNGMVRYYHNAAA